MFIFSPEVAIPAAIIWTISAIGLRIIRSEAYENLAYNSMFFDMILPGILWILFYLTIVPALVFVICLIAIFVSLGGHHHSHDH